MKKIFLFIIIILTALTACTTDTYKSEKPTVTTDRRLLQVLESRSDITQSETSDVLSKIAESAKNIINWANANNYDTSVIKETVWQFMENCEYSDEVFDVMETIIDFIETISYDKAMDLLKSIGLSAEDFELESRTRENIEKLISVIKDYIANK